MILNEATFRHFCADHVISNEIELQTFGTLHTV